MLEAVGRGHRSDDDDDAVMPHDQDDCAGHGVGTSVDTTQEARDRSILCVAPEENAWLPPQRALDRLSDPVSNCYQIILFDSSIIHGLKSSTINFCNEHGFFIDVFSKHRWYSGNHKRDGASLIRAYNALIYNVGESVRNAWLDNLTLSHNGFDKPTSTGARYKLHCLSRDAGLPCLMG